jgi:hypothetical protein
MKIGIEHRYDLAEAAESFLIKDGRLWTVGGPRREVMRFEVDADRRLSEIGERRRMPTATGGLAWDGARFLVADAATRRVIGVDSATGTSKLLIEPTNLDYGGFPKTLCVEAALIGDIAWDGGGLWVTCIAGYSSSIYRVDPSEKVVLSHRWAPGPRPVGIDLEPARDSLFVIDGRNKELRRLDNAGQWVFGALPGEVKEPRGMSFESPRKLWVADVAAGAVYGLTLED